MARGLHVNLTLDHIIDSKELIRVLGNRLGMIIMTLLKVISDGKENGMYGSAKTGIRKIITVLLQKPR